MVCVCVPQTGISGIEGGEGATRGLILSFSLRPPARSRLNVVEDRKQAAILNSVEILPCVGNDSLVYSVTDLGGTARSLGSA